MTQKKKLNRRPRRSRRRPGRVGRLSGYLPQPVEKMPVVKKTVRYLDDQEHEAEKALKRLGKDVEGRVKKLERSAKKTPWFKRAKKQRAEVEKQLDRLLANLGLVRLSVHESTVEKLKAKAPAKKKRATKKKTAARKTATKKTTNKKTTAKKTARAA